MGVTSDFQLLSLFIVEAAATVFSSSYAPDTGLDHATCIIANSAREAWSHHAAADTEAGIPDLGRDPA